MDLRFLLVLLPACGAAALYLALPGGRRRVGGLAFLFLAAALTTLVALTAPLLAGGGEAWFYGLSTIGILAAARMITHRKPVYSALYFVLVVLAVTGLLILMQAEFVAAALLIIYAGAILVTYLFVIMLAQQSDIPGYDRQAREPFFGCIGGFVILAVVAGRLFPAAPGEPLSLAAAEEFHGAPVRLGAVLFTNYVLAVQLAGVLLLAAMVGAIAIARRKAQVQAPEAGPC